MPKKKTDLQKAAGKLISAIQKEWGNDLGEKDSEFSENIMDSAHDLLQAGTPDKMKAVLNGMTVKQYLGEIWVQQHPRIKPMVVELQKQLARRLG